MISDLGNCFGKEGNLSCGKHPRNLLSPLSSFSISKEFILEQKLLHLQSFRIKLKIRRVGCIDNDLNVVLLSGMKL